MFSRTARAWPNVPDMTIPPLFFRISNGFKLSTFSPYSLGEVLDEKHRGVICPKGGEVSRVVHPLRGFFVPVREGGANLPLYIQIAVDYHLGGGAVDLPL